MNFEADSSLAPSSFQSMLKQSSQVSSAVWAHYHAACDDEDSDSKLKYCTYCTTLKIYCTNISFNMQKHLKAWHNIDVDIVVSQVQVTILQQLEQLYLQAKSFSQTKEINAQVFQK